MLEIIWQDLHVRHSNVLQIIWESIISDTSFFFEALQFLMPYETLTWKFKTV